MLHNILIIGAGSALGGIARYLVGRVIGQAGGDSFPWATLTVNLAGCLIIGLICGLMARGAGLGDGWRLFLTVGFCGGFTTFSTFMNEGYMLIEGGRLLSAAIYAGGSIAGGLAMVGLGYWLMRP